MLRLPRLACAAFPYFVCETARMKARASSDLVWFSKASRLLLWSASIVVNMSDVLLHLDGDALSILILLCSSYHPIQVLWSTLADCRRPRSHHVLLVYASGYHGRTGLVHLACSFQGPTSLNGAKLDILVLLWSTSSHCHTSSQRLGVRETDIYHACGQT